MRVCLFTQPTNIDSMLHKVNFEEYYLFEFCLSFPSPIAVAVCCTTSPVCSIYTYVRG